MSTDERIVKVAGCAACPYRNLDRDRGKDWLCGHPDMTRKFSVSAFTQRGEFPKRCPLKEK